MSKYLETAVRSKIGNFVVFHARLLGWSKVFVYGFFMLYPVGHDIAHWDMKLFDCLHYAQYCRLMQLYGLGIYMQHSHSNGDCHLETTTAQRAILKE